MAGALFTRFTVFFFSSATRSFEESLFVSAPEAEAEEVSESEPEDDEDDEEEDDEEEEDDSCLLRLTGCTDFLSTETATTLEVLGADGLTPPSAGKLNLTIC